MSTESQLPAMRFQRANYVVQDLDRALTLYRDILGFAVAFVKNSEPTSYSYEVFEIPHIAKLRFAVLSLGEQTNVLALTEITNLSLPTRSAPNLAALVLECQPFDEVCRAVRELGLTIFEEGSLVTKDGRTGREQGFLDFDGNLIVIYKILTYPSL